MALSLGLLDLIMTSGEELTYLLDYYLFKTGGWMSCSLEQKEDVKNISIVFERCPKKQEHFPTQVQL